MTATNDPRTPMKWSPRGGKVQAPGKPATELATGNPIMNLREVPHAGWTNVGSTTIRLVTVHVVDKGKPLYDESKK